VTPEEALAFEAAILDVLADETDGARIRERLLAHPACQPARDWIAGCEPRMLGVGAGLVRQWGVRGPAR
jgi:hypothetical protein